jgi:hypothetical protein
MNTLAARGLEELFSSCAVVSGFWFLAGNRFWCYLLTYLDYNKVVAIVFGVTYVLSVQYTCAVVSVFWLWREIVLWWEIVLKMQTPFDFLWAVSMKKSYWVTLLWSNSRCVYFVRPNTLLLCIFLFCIFLLYRTDPQVEVQIRISQKYHKLLQPHSHDRFSKVLRNFCASRK